MLFSLAALHMFSKASIASAVTLSSLLSFALMAKGILRVRITALTNTLIAAFALMPNCSQRLSNIAFCCESILTVIDVCAMTLSVLINIDCKYRAF